MSSPYPYPIHRLIIPALRILFGVRSSLSHDARLLLTNVNPKPRVIGAENIPTDSPFIFVLNHPDHENFAAWWGVSLLATTIADRRMGEPREIRFVMAREWWYPAGWEKRIKQPFTRWLFGQVSKTYGILLLPPIVEEYKGMGGVYVRKILGLTREPQPALIGISPEGRTGENVTLCQPPTGAGLFLEMLSHNQIPFLPVGFYTQDKTMFVNFGKLFMLHVPRRLPRPARDCEITRQVMIAIGKLLPEKMWGTYAQDISGALESENPRTQNLLTPF